jgi:hypothetical protein
MRRYRDNLGRKVAALATLKAVASSGGIAAWVIWREYAIVWGAIIALSQLADALKDVFPFVKQHKAASEHAIALDSMFIDAELEWENIYSGRFADEQIMLMWHKLKRLQHDLERKNFPDGPASRESLMLAAEAEAEDYFASTPRGVKIAF